MVEGTAFKGESTIFSFISGMGELKSFVRYLWRLAFENWWDDQQKREEKGSVFKKTASSTQQVSSSASMASSATSMKKTTDKKVAIGFEGFNFGMGMGLRAAMPKLPSFRVILLIHSLVYFCDSVEEKSVDWFVLVFVFFLEATPFAHLTLLSLVNCNALFYSVTSLLSMGLSFYHSIYRYHFLCWFIFDYSSIYQLLIWFL